MKRFVPRLALLLTALLLSPALLAQTQRFTLGKALFEFNGFGCDGPNLSPALH